MQCSAAPPAAAAIDRDTRDTLPTMQPIHIKAKRITLPPITAAEEANSHRPRLTLSAFRRSPVRLTQSDPSRRLEEEYNMKSPGCGILGHGAFSTVRLAQRNLDGLKVAVKTIAKHDALRARRIYRRRSSCSSSHHDEWITEWSILQEMRDHPNIITLIDVFETEEEIHLVTEFCEGGELFDAIQKKRMRSPAVQRGRYSELQAACITRQLLTALRDLHARNIVHRDLKPENICLVSESDSNIHAKLCDFGMARLFHRRESSSATASPGSTTSAASDVETPPSTPGRQRRSFCAVSCDYYAAPEVCAVGAAHQPSADVYSLGVTLYILLCGFPPVFSEDCVVFPEVQWNSISEDAKQLVRRMLYPDPSLRITAEEALRDNWILHHVYSPTNSSGSRVDVSSSSTSFTSRKPAARLSPESPSRNNTGKERVNLEQVRNRLYQAIARLNKNEPASTKKARRASDAIVSPKRKRRRSLECQRRSSIVCAMKELYDDVTSVSAPASAASAGVVCNDDGDKQDVCVYNEELGYEDPDALHQRGKKTPSLSS